MTEKIFWIGEDIDEKNNKEDLQKKLNKTIKRFSTPEKAFDFLSQNLKKYNFQLIYGIINGELSDDFYNLYRKKINEINNLIANIIICPNIYQHINKNYINDLFFNPGGITDDIRVVENYINYMQNYKYKELGEKQDFNLYQNLSDFQNGKYEKIFEHINKLDEIIVPALKEEFMEQYMKQININEVELYEFQKNLLSNYPTISNYIYPPNEKCIKVPFNIIAKYFLFLYTLESNFYSDMNRILTLNEGKDIYRIYINVLYKSLYNNVFKRFSDSELYRGGIMTKEEFENIVKQFEGKANCQNKNVNLILIHSKNFLSFSKDKTTANVFVENSIAKNVNGIKNGKFIAYKFFLQKSKNPDFLANNIEVDENNTFFQKEKEVLFFPFSCFLVKDIAKDSEKIHIEEQEIGINYIYLNYLDGYQNDIKEKINQIKYSHKMKESFENAFLNNVGKELYLFFGDSIIIEFEKYIKVKTGISINVEKPNVNIEYGNPVKEEFHPENQNKVKDEKDKKEIIELDEVIYNVEEKDIDNEGYVNILGKEFIKINNNKISLIINGKEENICHKYKLKKGKNKIKFIFKEAITNFNYLFYECTSLSNISALNSWDVSNATNLTSLFYGCTSLKNINGLKNWDVSNVNHFSYLFYECQSLTDISGLKFWNVKKGFFFSCLFSKCISLVDIRPLKNWDVCNGIFFNHLFSGCTSLKDISGLENWNVSKGNYFDHLFYNCESLSDIMPLKNWDVSNGINFSYCFHNCDSLSNISALKNWNIGNGSNFISMFSDNILSDTKPSWFYKSS